MRDKVKRDIIRVFQSRETFSLHQVDVELGGHYYANSSKHLGDVLARMVAGGMLYRVKPGVFAWPGTAEAKEAEAKRRQKLDASGQCRFCRDKGCLYCVGRPEEKNENSL